MRMLIPAALFFLLWGIASWIVQNPLLPSPLVVLSEMTEMVSEVEPLQHVLITFFRSFLGLLIALGFALIIGVPAGRSPRFLALISPLVAALQSCPTIVWVSLLMVWVGLGSIVPVAALVVVAFPALFLNIAQGTAALSPRLLAMAKLYRVERKRVISSLILPGIAPYLLAGLSFASGLSWKVISTAEFIASPTGVGAQIYNSYRMLDIPRLFSWALILVLVGLLIETQLVQPLRTVISDGKRNGS